MVREHITQVGVKACDGLNTDQAIGYARLGATFGAELPEDRLHHLNRQRAPVPQMVGQDDQAQPGGNGLDKGLSPFARDISLSEACAPLAAA